MKTIIQFLKSQVDPFSESLEKVNSIEKDIESLRNLFLNRLETGNQTRHLKIQPEIQRNQIWTIKNEYDDFQGISQKTTHPFIVLINSDPDDIDGELFFRVYIISPFIELATVNDEICLDSSIIGFPFMVESWNDQPILAELLDEYFGYYNVKSKIKARTETLSEIQQEFRDIEISRAKYINHSVLSLLSFMDNRQSQDAGAVVSINDKIIYPSFIKQDKNSPTNLVAEPIIKYGYDLDDKNQLFAAKSAIDSEDKYLLFESVNLPFKILIRKNEFGFILSVNSTEKIQLFTASNVEIMGISNKEKTVFEKLKPGNYTFITEQFRQPIKIRLK